MLKDMMTPADVHTGIIPDEFTKDSAIRKAATYCTDSGATVEQITAAFFKREEEYSTGCGGGIAAGTVVGALMLIALKRAAASKAAA